MIRGHLTFNAQHPVKAGQDITVTLQDTSRVGDASIDVAQTTARVPDGFNPATDVVPFEIESTNAPANCTIKAHLARHSGTDIQKGDLITTASIPATKDADVSVPMHLVD